MAESEEGGATRWIVEVYTPSRFIHCSIPSVVE
jgi:hypothetical protein